MSTQFKARAGIARTADSSTITAPSRFLGAGSVQLASEPITAETDALLYSQDAAFAEHYGFKHSFEVSGLELQMGQLGYLIWLMLGQEVYAAAHILTPAITAQYFCLQLDRTGGDLDLDSPNDKPTEALVGCKMSRLRVEVPMKGFAKATISGMACDRVDEQDALAPSLLSGPNNVPLSWKAFQTGSVDLGYGGVAPAGDDNIKGLNFEFTRDLNDEDTDLGNDQPSDINEGRRGFQYEIMKRFSGNAAAAYQAWKAQQYVELDATGQIGANSINIASPSGHWIGTFPEPVSASADASMAGIRIQANRNQNTEQLVTITVIDETGVAYT